MNDTTDLLQIKIDKARRELSPETQKAIAAVDWKAAILGLRQKKGYTFEQLGNLDTETDLLLSGLLSPEEYPKELAKRLQISGAETKELISDMNDLVFKKIREELVKITDGGKTVSEKETPAQISNTLPILEEKLSGAFSQIPKVETDHSLENITKTNTPPAATAKPAIDPYREIPE